MKRYFLILIYSVFLVINVFPQQEIPKSYIEKATRLSELMAKNLNLTETQRQFVAENIIKRESNNYFKTKETDDFNTQHEIINRNFKEYVANLQKELPEVLVNKILLFERKKMVFSS